jgi:hypothetical protein
MLHFFGRCFLLDPLQQEKTLVGECLRYAQSRMVEAILDGRVDLG